MALTWNKAGTELADPATGQVFARRGPGLKVKVAVPPVVVTTPDKLDPAGLPIVEYRTTGRAELT